MRPIERAVTSLSSSLGITLGVMHKRESEEER